MRREVATTYSYHVARTLYKIVTLTQSLMDSVQIEMFYISICYNDHNNFILITQPELSIPLQVIVPTGMETEV